MEYIILAIASFTLTIVLVGLPVLFVLTALQLAKKGIFWSMPGEGKAIVIMTNDQFGGVVARYQDHHINDPNEPWFNTKFRKWEVLKDSENEKFKPTHNKQGLMEKYFGLVYIGLPPKREYQYSFEWGEAIQDRSGKVELWSRKEMTNFIYLSRFPYLIYISEAETAENIAVNAFVVVEVECNNPRVALFENTDWLVAVSAVIVAVTRSYIGMSTFDTLRREASAKPGEPGGETSLNKVLQILNDSLPSNPTTGTKIKYGITITSGSMQNIDVANDDDKSVTRSLTAKYVAEQEANATIERAKGTKNSTIIIAEGRKKEAELLDKAGSTALLVQWLSAIKTEGKGDKIVVAPTLEDLLKRIGRQ